MGVEYFVEATADDGTVKTHGPYPTEDDAMKSLLALKDKGFVCTWYPAPKDA